MTNTMKETWFESLNYFYLLVVDRAKYNKRDFWVAQTCFCVVKVQASNVYTKPWKVGSVV
jgi:hypothetical protein